MPLGVVRHVLEQVLNALEAAHALDIVHRDIKPDNVMLQSVPGDPCFVRVLDFGLARFLESQRETSLLLGTPAFMAPEQVTREGIGPWTDLYALGVLAFEMLTGRRPFDGETPQEVLAKKLDPDFDPRSFVEQAGDIFFQIQGAWTRRDLTSVGHLLTPEMRGLLQAEADKLQAAGQINRLENIAVRSIDLHQAWQEAGQDYVTVHLLASLLDYTVDERGGQVLSGSDRDPVKFEELWTFTRPVGPGPWRLSAITQIN
jgi:serine/threonine protein kinase